MNSPNVSVSILYLYCHLHILLLYLLFYYLFKSLYINHSKVWGHPEKCHVFHENSNFYHQMSCKMNRKKSTFCSVNAPETFSHLFWDCPVITIFWEISYFLIKLH